MMFCFLKLGYINGLLLYIALFISYSFASDFKILSNFENNKNTFIKETNSFKLDNYLRKIKMKNSGIINDKNQDNFLFLDTSEKDRMMIKNLKYADLNFDKMQDPNNFDEFKARLFAYIYKNKNINQGEIYNPIGVNYDEEKEPGWKILLVLMNSNKDGKHKLLKVCFRENSPKENFSIILNFEKSCINVIDKIKKNGILDKDNSSKKIHSLESKILSSKLKTNLVKNKNANSFIEKSSITSTASSSSAFTFETLAQKFSVNELNKIKSLIKFAKVNGIIDEVSKRKGNVYLEELKPSMNSTNYTLISRLSSEITDLKSIIDNQNKKLENYFKDMNQNMNVMKEMASLVKDLSGQMHKSLLNSGNTLSNVDNKLNSNTQEYKFKEVQTEGNNENAIKNEPAKPAEIQEQSNSSKEIQQLIDVKKSNEKSSQLNSKKANKSKKEKPKIVSPFLSADSFGSMEEDDILEGASAKKGKQQKKAKSKSRISDDDEDFIDT